MEGPLKGFGTVVGGPREKALHEAQVAVLGDLWEYSSRKINLEVKYLGVLTYTRRENLLVVVAREILGSVLQSIHELSMVGHYRVRRTIARLVISYDGMYWENILHPLLGTVYRAEPPKSDNRRDKRSWHF